MDERPQVALRLGDWPPVSGPKDAFVAGAQLVERGHVSAHRAVRRRHDRSGPRHHMVAGEERLLLEKREAEVVRAMAGRRDRLDSEAAPGEALAVVKRSVGRVVAIV